MKNKALLLLVTLGSLFCLDHAARAQILVNGSFEDNSATIGTGKISDGYAAITGWQNIGTMATNSGVQYGTTGTGLNQSQSGNYFSYQSSDDGNGSNKGAFQITNTTLNVGDQITLTWYAAGVYQSPIQNVDLLAASSPGSAFSSATILTPTNTPDLTLNSTYTEYTLTYTATSADIGKYIGVSFTTTGVENSYAQYDNFVLTDTTASIPEPATDVLLFAGLAGFILIRRLRRSLV